MLPGNIFGLILKNKMAARDVYSTLNKDFCWPSRVKGIMSTPVGVDILFLLFPASGRLVSAPLKEKYLSYLYQI